MTASALVTGLLGLAGMLFPAAILGGLGAASPEGAVVPVKLLGAAYLGGALLNWMAREKLIGGIYSRPVAVGNFTHYFAATIVLTKALVSTPNVGLVAAGALLFGGLAVGFGYITFAGGDRCA